MPNNRFQVQPIAAFNDNYIWCLQGHDGTCLVVDPGDATPVLDYLQEHQLQLSAILITHHHGDHIGGLRQLLTRYEVPVYGPSGGHIKGISQPLQDGDSLRWQDIDFNVIAVPGHTLDHIAYFADIDGVPRLFCGDTLFAAGCGRLFEGTAKMLQQSLQRLAELPSETLIYCAHEYTLSNLAFAVALMPNNPQVRQRQQDCQNLRRQGLPTLPSRMQDELATNPFLRCSDSEVIANAQQHADLSEPHPDAVFAAIRQWKNTFIS